MSISLQPVLSDSSHNAFAQRLILLENSVFGACGRGPDDVQADAAHGFDHARFEQLQACPQLPGPFALPEEIAK